MRARRGAQTIGRRLRGKFGTRLLVTTLLFQPVAAVAQEPGDPLEPMNRAIFRFNDVVDGLFIEPAARLYGLTVPQPARKGIRNFLDNLGAPVIFVNDLLQGNRERAGVTLSRFMINTVLGGAGLFDMAQVFGHTQHYEDFGQTLGVWGVDEGFYLVLPLLGPSNPRDAVGRVFDSFVFDPVAYVASTEERIGRAVVDAIDTRYTLIPAIDDLRANSIDPYATARTVYRQRRASAIRNGGSPTESDEYEDIFTEGLDDADGQ
jgi:phospholipid-binding lipoprotein MlaA